MLTCVIADMERPRIVLTTHRAGDEESTNQHHYHRDDNCQKKNRGPHIRQQRGWWLQFWFQSPRGTQPILLVIYGSLLDPLRHSFDIRVMILGCASSALSILDPILLDVNDQVIFTLIAIGLCKGVVFSGVMGLLP